VERGDILYLQHIHARNFRAFGDGAHAPELNWDLNRGMNILVGENDAGKTATVDAIRQVLWTALLKCQHQSKSDLLLSWFSR
jgi:predicted ATP-dependent endonuclease of OLD family